MATDSIGDLYVAGFYSSTVDFDPGSGTDNHTSNGLTDAFLSMYAPGVGFQWARTWGGNAEDDTVDDLAVDSSGNAYVGGLFAGSVDFDPGPGTADRTAAGLFDGFLSKLDIAGNYLWVDTWGSPGFDVVTSVAYCASSNAVLAAGYFDFGSLVDFNPDPVGEDGHWSKGNWDCFLVKVETDGTW